LREGIPCRADYTADIMIRSRKQMIYYTPEQVFLW
jgi:hypothetical protein